jgi:NAD(P)-dependent dehydrogenase (short-subunit alcohol dehydrogenase family)
MPISSDSPRRALAGRTAIVTGASRGIGRAIALLFAREGADVVLVSRSAESLAQVFDEASRAGGTAMVVAADVTTEDAADRILARTREEFGRLDVLVNNAGGNSFTSPLASMRFGGWQKTMTLNVDSTVRLIQASLPDLAASGHGSIINVSSVAGLRGVPGMSHYSAAKAAVISLSQSLAVEVAPQGVRVNALIPGWIETDLTGFLRTDESVEAMALERVPMARWGRPEEIAQGALFLASDASSFMTGQCLVLDGGLTAH